MRWLVLFGAAAAVAAGFGGTAGGLPTRTVACPARTVTVVFDPKHGAYVRDFESVLASASFTRAAVSSRCTRVREPTAFVDGGLAKTALYRRATITCAASTQLRVHINAITSGGRVVGSNLLVGIGPRLRVIASAVLKNGGDPRASRLYRAPKYCHGN